MNPFDIDPGVNTKVKITSELSHGYILLLGVASIVSLVAGFIFLGINPSLAWVPFLFVFIFLIPSSIFWTTSHKNVELKGAHPTVVSRDSGRTQVTTDSRLLNSPEAVQALERLFVSIGHREPLPMPDGLVDSKGAPVPDSEEEATRRIEQINEELSKQTNTAITALAKGSRENLLDQPILLDKDKTTLESITPGTEINKPIEE